MRSLLNPGARIVPSRDLRQPVTGHYKSQEKSLLAKLYSTKRPWFLSRNATQFKMDYQQLWSVLHALGEGQPFEHLPIGKSRSICDSICGIAG